MGLYIGETLIAPIVSDNTLQNPLSWMGKDPEVIEMNFKSASTTLDATTFPAWTPSTTAKTIVTSTTTKNFAADLENYEYIIEWFWDVVCSYKDGTTYQACPERQFGTIYQIVHRRAYGYTSFANDVADRNYCTALYSASNYIIYWKSNGSKTWTTSPSYGFYGVSNAATLGSDTALTTTFNPKTPSFNARCSTSYFDIARAPEVDQPLTTLKYTGNVYRVKVGSSCLKPMYMNASHLYAHPL